MRPPEEAGLHLFLDRVLLQLPLLDYHLFQQLLLLCYLVLAATLSIVIATTVETVDID